MAIYPTSIFPWANRVNNIDIVWAADPNSLASEIQAIESTIGVNPQIEKYPPVGTGVNQIAYKNVDQRISDAQNNNLLPYAQLASPNFFINQGQQMFQTYQIKVDPFNIWNGIDGTIPCTGWWIISGAQKWNQHGNSFIGGNLQFLFVNGTWVVADLWNWDNFFGNPAFHFASDTYAGNGFTYIFWQGILNKGDRIQVLAANSTFCPGIVVSNVVLDFCCVRTIGTAP